MLLTTSSSVPKGGNLNQQSLLPPQNPPRLAILLKPRPLLSAARKQLQRLSSAGSLSPETRTMHFPAQRRLPTDQSRQPCTLYMSARVLENCNSHLSTQHAPTSPEPSTVCRSSAP